MRQKQAPGPPYSAVFDYFCIVRRILLISLLVCCVMGKTAAYNDHRGHNLDSLERVVAKWTPDAIDKASTGELIDLNNACRDLML